ncbi:MAG: pirin family protein [Campylobacterales bacterium]|nr:pirin family protein [Campylobacterales bacterium]
MSCIVHRAHERGIAEHGWLHSRFSFSFAEYRNTNRMGFGALRVINDDVIEAGMGFGMHPHRDMEIVSIVTKGALEHKDSEGNHGIIHAGQIQYMSAGSGVMHSEYATEDEDAALFQIWIHPDRKGGVPLYDNRDFSTVDQNNRWAALVSGDGRDHSILIRQDAAIYSTHLDKDAQISVAPVKPFHGRLIFVMEGSVEIAGDVLNARDELQITDKEEYALRALSESKILLFDVPMH